MRVYIGGVAVAVELVGEAEVKQGDTVSGLTDELRAALLRGAPLDWDAAWADTVEVTEHPSRPAGRWYVCFTDGSRELFADAGGGVVRWRVVTE